MPRPMEIAFPYLRPDELRREAGGCYNALVASLVPMRRTPALGQRGFRRGSFPCGNRAGPAARAICLQLSSSASRENKSMRRRCVVPPDENSTRTLPKQFQSMTDMKVSEDLELRRRAAELLLQVIDRDWGDKHKKPVAVLHALCQLERDSPTTTGHEALEIARRLKAQGDRDASRDVAASESDKGEAVRKLINRRFGRLENTLWPSRAGEGSVVEHRFLNSGLGVLPRPRKIINVGSGNVNRFVLNLEALPAAHSESLRTVESPPP